MSNVLAALFGGLGAGASSYGGNLMREQEQQRLAQQRMAELQQQEQARIAAAREAAMLRQQQLKEEGEQAATIARAMGIELPEGARLNTQGVQVLGQYHTNKRAAEAEAGRNSRFADGITSREGMFNAKIDSDRAYNDARTRLLEAQIDKLRSGMGGGNQPPIDTRKPLPASVGKELGEVGDVYALIRDAKAGMATPEAKNATGWKYNIANILMPASLESRAQSMIDGGKGDMVRARLGNLWSTIGKLRSGGAITDSEFKRLEPFLPSSSDDFGKANTKLAELERAYGDIIQRKVDMYGGTYKVPEAGQIMQGRGYSPNNPFAGRKP